MSDHNGNGKKEPAFVLERPKTPEEIQRDAIRATMPKLRRECSRDSRLRKCVGAKWLFGVLTDNSFINDFGGNGFGLVYTSLKDLCRWYGHDEDTFATWRDKLIETGWIWYQERWPKSCWGITGVCRQPELFPSPEYVRIMAKASSPDQPKASVGPSQNGKTEDSGHNHRSSPADQPPLSVTPTATDGRTNRELRSDQPKASVSVGGESRSDQPPPSVTPTAIDGQLDGNSRVGATANHGHTEESPRSLGASGGTGGGTGTPPPEAALPKNNGIEAQLDEWKAATKDLYPSRRPKLLAELKRDVAKAKTQKLKAFLQTKVAFVEELIKGPKPEFPDDKPIAAAATQSQPESEEGQRVKEQKALLDGAHFLLKTGDHKRLTPEHRAALATIGVNVP